jgi:hypothetical protein
MNRSCSYLWVVALILVGKTKNLFVFDDEIEMKNRSTIQTLTFVQTNPDHSFSGLSIFDLPLRSGCSGSQKVGARKIAKWAKIGFCQSSLIYAKVFMILSMTLISQPLRVSLRFY